MMWGSHIYLICMGKSTVESYAERDQHEMEASVLQAEFGYLWHNQAKKKTQKRWEEEWGGESVDGRWRWGNKMQMWRQEMGDTVLGWISESSCLLTEDIV
jgi:palmitoyltransferase